LAVFWGLKLSAPRQVLAVPQAGGPAAVQVDGAAMARLFGVQEGAPAAAPAAPTRWRLLGVMAGKNSGGGAAVIAVDDQPAKVFRVGTVVADGLVLQSLRSDAPRAVTLGAGVDGPAAMTIALPALRPIDAVAAPAPGNPAAPPVQAAVPTPATASAPVADSAANVDRSTGSLRD
jgi:general secretion pathway protein C